ncbi:MAG: hypothetical protein P4L22_05395 [Candidatus Babeliales bacterium]|nr:hypothetical protein [Candidatus Babeliales bacterium]
MKKNSCFIHLLLVAALLQPANNLIASEDDSSASSSEALVESSKCVPSETHALKLKSFLSKCQQTGNNNKGFLGALAIAASMWKTDQDTALLNAIRYIMRIKGAEWCMISLYNRLPANLLIFSGEQPSEDAQSKLQSLKGKKQVLSLDSLDSFTGKKFRKLMGSAESYIVAEASNGTYELEERRYFDARELNSSLNDKSGLLSGIFHENDASLCQFTITFPEQVAGKDVLDVHYFEFTPNGNFTHLGSIKDIDTPNQKNQENLLNKFVNMLSKEELIKKLADLNLVINDDRYFNNSSRDANVSKIIIILQAILENLKKDNKDLSDSNVILAKLLLYKVYLKSGKAELAEETVKSIPLHILFESVINDRLTKQSASSL